VPAAATIEGHGRRASLSSRRGYNSISLLGRAASDLRAPGVFAGIPSASSQPTMTGEPPHAATEIGFICYDDAYGLCWLWRRRWSVIGPRGIGERPDSDSGGTHYTGYADCTDYAHCTDCIDQD
jgi:hypothetical protein